MKPWKLLEVKYNGVRENAYSAAVLPLGATEPHNLHLPYGTDTITTEWLGDLICEKAYALGAKVILLPCVPFGVDSNLMSFPLTISLDPSTLDRIITDVVQSVEAHGIRKLVLFNGHGGNSLKHTLRELFGKTQCFLSLVDWYTVCKDIYSQIFDAPDDHAGEMETSLALHLFPELTELSLADDGATRASRFEAIRKGWVQVTRPFGVVTRHCAIGNPKKATAEKGRRLIEALVDRLGTYLKELSDAKMDETFPF